MMAHQLLRYHCDHALKWAHIDPGYLCCYLSSLCYPCPDCMQCRYYLEILGAVGAHSILDSVVSRSGCPRASASVYLTIYHPRKLIAQYYLAFL